MVTTTSLAAAIEALTAAVRTLAAAMAPEAATAAEPMALPEEWADWSVVELRAMLRSLPIDRRELPAPIEKLRRQELLDALQQLQC